jgi:hypothetical protein
MEYQLFETAVKSALAISGIVFLLTSTLTLALNEAVCAAKPTLRKKGETGEYLRFSLWFSFCTFIVTFFIAYLSVLLPTLSA